MDKIKLKKWILENLFGSNNRLISSRLSPKLSFYKQNIDLFNQLIKITDIYENLTIQERIYILLNDLNREDIICNVCNNRKKLFISFNKGYRNNCSKECSNISKDRIDKIKDTKIKLYGYSSWNMNKTRETVKKKYGVDNISQNIEIRNKINHTIKKRYGVDNVMKLQCFKDKIVETNRKRYKHNYALQSEDIKNKTKFNNSFKYGVNYPVQQHIDNFNEWINDKSFIEIYNKIDYVEDIAKYFNIKSLATIYQRARKLDLSYKSRKRDKVIKEIGKIIESYGYEVEYNNRSIIKPLEIDLVIKKDNEIIKTLEYNGLMFHSLGLSEHLTFNNWSLYKDNLEKFISKDRIKLDKCKDLDIELLILREDIYLNDNTIIDKWINSKLKYEILDEPIIYRFRGQDKLEEISIENIGYSIEINYRVYFDWIKLSI